MQDLDPTVLTALKTFGTTDASLETMGASAGTYQSVANHKRLNRDPTVWTVTYPDRRGRDRQIFVLTVAGPGEEPRLLCWRHHGWDSRILNLRESTDGERLKEELHRQLRHMRLRAIVRHETATYTDRVTNHGIIGTVMLAMLIVGLALLSGISEDALQTLAIRVLMISAIMIFLILWPLNKPLVNMFVTQKHLDEVWDEDEKAKVIDALAEQPA